MDIIEQKKKCNFDEDYIRDMFEKIWEVFRIKLDFNGILDKEMLLAFIVKITKEAYRMGVERDLKNDE